MGVVELTGAIVGGAKLSDERLRCVFCSGLAILEEEGEKGKGGRPSAPSLTGCFQDRGGDECKSGWCLLTRSQSELRAFNRGRSPSIQSLGGLAKIIELW